ncbi:MAG: hypothetical protein ACI8UP_004526, partial [Porticoccaceae bacterium]
LALFSTSQAQLLKLNFSSSTSQAQLLQFTSRMQLILVLFIQLISNNSKLRFSPATPAFSSAKWCATAINPKQSHANHEGNSPLTYFGASIV